MSKVQGPHIMSEITADDIEEMKVPKQDDLTEQLKQLTADELKRYIIEQKERAEVL